MADESCVPEKVCAAIHKAVSTRFAAMDQALTLRTADLEARLRGLNELRTEVVNDRGMFIPKTVYDERTRFYESWIRGVDEKLTRMETNYQSRLTYATALSTFSAIIAVLAVIIPWILYKG